MHFLMSLMFLILIGGLVYAYIAGTYLSFILFRGVIRRWRNRKSEEVQPPIIDTFQKRVFKIVAVLTLIMCTTTYIGLRTKWTTKDNGNLVAKEYFVAGQTLNAYKAVLTTFLHPELPIILPMTKLQWFIYEKGVAYLPENDGEAGVWQNYWFHYHFNKRDWEYWGVVGHKPSPKMVKILDQYWFCLETMATNPFADKKMNNQYLEGFPGLAFRYAQEKGFYSGKHVGSAHRMAQLPKYVDRSYKLVKWLSEVRSKWETSPEMAERVLQNPKLFVLYQLGQLRELQDIMHGEIYSREFSCDKPYIQQFINTRKEFADPDVGYPAYSQISNAKEKKSIYYIAINSAGPRSFKYIVEHYCGLAVAGEEDMSTAIRFAKDYNITPEEEAERQNRAGIPDEIKILEELFNNE